MFIYCDFGVLPASRLNSAVSILGSKVGIICSGRYRVSWKKLSATTGSPCGVRPLPRHMVLLQHIIIVQRLLLSSFLARFRVPGLIPCQLPVICKRKREGSQTGSMNIISQILGFRLPSRLASAGRGEM